MEATVHDLAALSLRPDWSVLHWTGEDYSRWRASLGCVGRKYMQACDEYPFNKTAEGGYHGPASLALIDWHQNSYQGSDLGVFYAAKGIRVRPYAAFAVIAIPDRNLRTFWLP